MVTPFEERFRGERNMACDRAGEDPCWHFPTLSGELKTFPAREGSFTLPSYAFTRGTLGGEMEGSITSPFTTTRGRKGVA